MDNNTLSKDDMTLSENEVDRELHETEMAIAKEDAINLAVEKDQEKDSIKDIYREILNKRNLTDGQEAYEKEELRKKKKERMAHENKLKKQYSKMSKQEMLAEMKAIKGIIDKYVRPKKEEK